MFDKKARVWNPRQRQPNIGRVYAVLPKFRETFYLRMLLHHVRGPTSFEHLRTVDGILHPTFHAACIAYGLLESDAHWINCLQEAVETLNPRAMRELFAVIAHSGFPSSPLELWDRFKEPMCEDFLHQVRAYLVIT